VSYLIFCSFEVGGLPYRMAEILNRYEVETYYIFLGKKASGHDSAQFHYGNRFEEWNLSNLFQNRPYNSRKTVKQLCQIKEKHNISYCLATGANAYLLKQAGMSYKYWSYGSDLDQRCFIPVWPPNYPLWKRLIKHPYLLFVDGPKARESIYQANSVMVAPYQIEALNKICPDKEMFFLPHHFKIIDYHVLMQQKTENKRIICKEIQAKRFFFSSVRHVWTGHLRNAADNKGNDVMLYSYAMYLKLSKDFDSKLVLVKKGPDVELSKSLSRSLGIDNHIVWINEMRREELDRYYRGATICFGQFGTPVITNSVLEPLANGSITISFFSEIRSAIPFYQENPPIFNSKDPKEIADYMLKTLSDQDYLSELPYKAWLWIKKNCSEEKFVESFLGLFTKDP
jgi:glycosyltransferase involved in cell wall biosynthesis